MSPFAKCGLAVMALAATMAPATAHDYPAKAVRILVPLGAGGPADLYARFLGQHRRRSNSRL